MAATGRERILEMKPAGLHQREPMMVGSKAEVERLIAYHAQFERVDQLNGREEAHLSAVMFNSLDTKSSRGMGSTCSGATDQHDVLVASCQRNFARKSWPQKYKLRT